MKGKKRRSPAGDEDAPAAASEAPGDEEPTEAKIAAPSIKKRRKSTAASSGEPGEVPAAKESSPKPKAKAKAKAKGKAMAKASAAKKPDTDDEDTKPASTKPKPKPKAKAKGKAKAKASAGRAKADDEEKPESRLPLNERRQRQMWLTGKRWTFIVIPGQYYGCKNCRFLYYGCKSCQKPGFRGVRAAEYAKTDEEYLWAISQMNQTSEVDGERPTHDDDEAPEAPPTKPKKNPKKKANKSKD